MELRGVKPPPGPTVRVANIIEEARLGGPQNRIAEVAARLREQGIETIVILPDKDNQVFVQKLQKLSVEYRVLSLHKLTRSKRGLLSFIFHFPGDIWHVRNAIKVCGAELVHCNSAGQWKGLIAARLTGRPALWHLNDTNSPGPVKPIFRLFACWATGFIPAAERVADYYLKNQVAAKPRFLIQAPVNCQLYDPATISADEQTARMSGVKIGNIGNVNADKDFLTYVQMARLLRKEFGDCVRCFQVGGQFKSQKDYVAKVKALNQADGDNIVLMHGTRTDVRTHLKAADIYVCSSRFEASPISVWEAMAMGLPIVSTDVGDIAAMNKDGDFARVVPTQDPAALASAVAELVNSPSERKRLGINARKYALENLDIEICVRKHAAAYLAVLRQ